MINSRQSSRNNREQYSERRPASERRSRTPNQGGRNKERENAPKDRLLGMLCFQIGLCVLLLVLLVTAKFIGGSSFEAAQQMALELCGIGQTEVEFSLSDWMSNQKESDLWVKSKELFEQLKEGFEQALHSNLATEDELRDLKKNEAGTIGESGYMEEEPTEEETEHSLQTSSVSAKYMQASVLGGQGGLLPVENDMSTLEFLEAPENATFAPYMISAALWTPVPGQLTSLFGYRYHPISFESDFHTGVDIAAPSGTAIHAALPGVVEETGWSNSYGNYIKLRHSPELVTTYSHCLEILAQEGERLSRGDRIAFVGSTGISTGPHLHFEIQLKEKRADPLQVLNYS